MNLNKKGSLLKENNSSLVIYLIHLRFKVYFIKVFLSYVNSLGVFRICASVTNTLHWKHANNHIIWEKTSEGTMKIFWRYGPMGAHLTNFFMQQSFNDWFVRRKNLHCTCFDHKVRWDDISFILIRLSLFQEMISILNVVISFFLGKCNKKTDMSTRKWIL